MLSGHPGHEPLIILGTCVQAPHSHSWGGYQYHNAAIIGLDTPNQKVRLCKIQNG